MRGRRIGADPAQIESIYRTRLADFRRVANAIVGDTDRGADAVQEAFGSALRRRRAFRGEAPLEAWLWRLVVNQARDERRAAARRPLYAGDVQPSSNGSAPHEHDLLATAITMLPERQRLVVFLRYYADLDYSSIAAALEIKEGTVGAALNAAHDTLRHSLQEAHR
ncbi:MAG: RNA polymerase sigma factor [Actinomycetota bacterium]